MDTSQRYRFQRKSISVRIICLLGFAALIHLGSVHPSVGQSKYAAMIIDHNTGRTLHTYNADAPRFPASLTKIMTLYLMFEALRDGHWTPDTVLTVTTFAAKQPPSSLGLKAGQKIRVRDAIKALVTKSANDVAVTIAENLAKSEAEFAKRMTFRARQMGMASTTFRNASGLPNSKQVTTARDMVILSRRIMTDFPVYYRAFNTRYFSYNGRRYKNHNKLLFNFNGTEGIKTGYTRASGFNLSASVKRGHKHVIGVVMGGKTAKRRDQQMRKLMSGAIKKAKSVKHPPLPVARSPRLIKKPTRVAASNYMVKPSAIRELRPSQPPVAKVKAPARPNAAQYQYHVQVGAYRNPEEARRRLETVHSKAAQYLQGHPAITKQVTVKSKRYFRARFAEFSKAGALSTCEKLKKLSFDCLVMSAN